MIHPNLIKRKADTDRLSASTVERDYVIAHILSAISRHDEQAQFVFKGGTALRFCHFDEYRYSADLDFSLIDGLNVDGALGIFEDILADCRARVDFPVLRLNDASPPRIEYVGPLGAKPRSLKIDLAHDELVESTMVLPIAPHYEDQEAGQCLVYTLDEITAEKLRCVMQRLQCRDLYDLHELLVVRCVDTDAAWPVFERKARHRGIDPGRFTERFDDRVSSWGHRWDTELVEYVSPAPHFDALLRAVRRELRPVLCR